MAGFMLAMTVGGHLRAEEPSPKAAGDKVLNYLTGRQKELRLEITAEPRHQALFRTEPLLRFTNPLSGAEGGVFVWTIDERPVAVSKTHVNPQKRAYILTTVALWDSPFQMTLPDDSTWEPRTPALKPVLLGDEAAPAESAAARLIQMKRLAAEIEFTVAWRNTPRDESQDFSLRLMPRPLYRYAAPKHGIVDGVIFGFSQGTNPEALVQLEAVSAADGMKWRCGVSRLTSHALTARYGGTLVLDEPARNSRRLGPTENYSAFYEQLPAEFLAD